MGRSRHGLDTTSGLLEVELLGGEGQTSLSRELRIRLLRRLRPDVLPAYFCMKTSDQLDQSILVATGLPPDTRLSAICDRFEELCTFCHSDHTEWQSDAVATVAKGSMGGSWT